VWHTIHKNDCGRFTYSQEPAAASSQTFCLDTYLSELAKSRTTQEPCCSSDNVTESCLSSQFGTTSEHSTENHGADLSMSSRVDFLARISAAPEKAQGSPAKEAGYGVKWRESLAKYDPATHSLRTRQGLLFEDSTECCATLPQWGIMQNGECWGVCTRVDGTCGNGFGYWPTPNACDATRGSPESPGDKKRRGANTGWSLIDVLGYIPHPEFVEWLMGWPINWTGLKPSATDKFHKWRRSHGKY